MEIDSPGFEITGKLTLRGIGPRGDFEKITPQKSNKYRKYFNPLVIGPGGFDL